MNWDQSALDVVSSGRAIGASDEQIKAALIADAQRLRVKANGFPRMSDEFYKYIEASCACERLASTL